MTVSSQVRIFPNLTDLSLNHRYLANVVRVGSWEIAVSRIFPRPSALYSEEDGIEVDYRNIINLTQSS